MGAIANEPSMEEILSSIKRIINEEDSGAGRNVRRRAPRPAAAVMSEDAEDGDDVLELTQPVIAEQPRPAAPAPRLADVSPAPVPAPAPADDLDELVLSPASAVAARESLSSLTAAVGQREATPAAQSGGQTIDGLVRELLTPMLKDWLDQHLPAMVEQMVKREIDRITAGLK